LEEFANHLLEFSVKHPELEPLDREQVFCAWAIQKIAGLQLIVERLRNWLELVDRRRR